jgi:hypothetical protein
MLRPAVDVVVPYRGGTAPLAELRERLAGLALGEGDTVTIVDNAPRARPADGRGGSPPRATGATRAPRVLRAPQLQTPGFARNRGAAAGSAPWLVFLDADVVPEPRLLERYFDPPPPARTAVLAGEVEDKQPDAGWRIAPRHAHARRAMSQETALAPGPWMFAQTANCACRRAAFDGVGGFCERVRAGEDADLCYRLRAAGWEVERRERARGVHRSRSTVRALLSQKACHGSAAAWLDERYPGSFPARRLGGVAWWGVRHAARGAVRGARRDGRGEALLATIDVAAVLAFELGRSLPNERPLRLRGRPRR